MASTVNIFLLLFGALQGALLTVLLIRKKAYRNAYVFLVAYLLVLILQILLKVVNKSWLIQNIDALYFTSYQLPFLYGPLVYLLALHLRQEDRRISWRDLIHFIPFPLAVVLTLSHLRFIHLPFLNSLPIDERFVLVVQLISISVYHFLALSQDPTDHQLSIRKNGRTTVRWFRQFVVGSLITTTAIAVGLFLLYTLFPRFGEFRWIFSGLTFFIYWIAYEAINQPEIFVVIKGGSSEGTAIHADLKLIVGRDRQKYGTSRLRATESQRIKSALDRLMTVEKVYLEVELTIDKLSERIPCSRHHLSQVINEKEGVSFNEFLNRFRVLEARHRLTDDGLTKIATIAFESGFSSLSTFNDAFKKITGVTPSDYRKQRVEERRLQS